MRIEVNDTELYLDVDGAQLAVRAEGLQQRPTVVALHGGPGFDQGYLRPGLGPLREYAQVVYVDLRGQGRSGRPPVETCTLEQMADDVAALCGRLGVDRPVAFGHSAGGFVALHLALRHPDLIGGLILCDTAPTLQPLPDTDPEPGLAERAPAAALPVAARVFGGDFSDETLEAFGRLVLPYYAGPNHQDVPSKLMALSGFSPDVATHFFNMIAPAYDVRARLPEIAARTLVMVGHYDWICPLASSLALVAGIPRAELVEVADAGHFVFSEDPDTFLNAIGRFLQSDSTEI